MSAAPVETRLAGAGKAAHPVVVSTNASPRTRAAAAALPACLGRISGAKFAMTAGDGAAGIAVGLAADFPNVAVTPPFDAKDPFAREDYVLRSHAGGVQLIGATELAVEHAVWDL